MKESEFYPHLNRNTPTCLLNGVPECIPCGYLIPSQYKLVGMEGSPNQRPRYGKMTHRWENLPCFETEGFQFNG